MNEQVESPVGVYGNLYSHISVPTVSFRINGPSIQLYIFRRCQGLSRVAIRVRRPPLVLFSLPTGAENWLLGSVIEIQAFLVTLLQNFNISPADHQPQIRRARAGMEAPLVLGEEYKGTQLPLKITAIRSA